MKIYLISAETGDDDEHSTWVVGAFLDETKATYYLRDLNNWLIGKNIPRNALKSCNRVIIPNNLKDKQLVERWKNHGVVYSMEEVNVIDK